MISKFSKIIDQFIDKCCKEIEKPDLKTKINNRIIKPLLFEICNSINYYILAILIMYIFILISLFFLVFIIVFKKSY